MLRPWPIYNKNIPNTSVGWKTIYLHLKSSGYTRSERLLKKNICYNNLFNAAYKKIHNRRNKK